MNRNYLGQNLRGSFLHIFCLVSYRVSNKHKDMGHVNFDNHDYHTSRTSNGN